jgi:hypothetical protein
MSRGRGPEAKPFILRLDASGRLEELSLEDVKHAKVSLANAPEADAKDRRGAPCAWRRSPTSTTSRGRSSSPASPTRSSPRSFGRWTSRSPAGGDHGAALSGETRWLFTPREPWRSGGYALRAAMILDDLAGNSLGRRFEVDAFDGSTTG